MINLTTGLPGASKTLYTLSVVNAISIKDNRPVYYSGIADLKLPWIEIDPEKWFECPKNSIVVIDECQRVFRPRTISKEVPKHVSMLETHRHLGIDIYLITQHPMLADSSIRRLVGRHLHIVRTFGTERSTVHEWASVKDNCDKSVGRSDSIKHLWKFDKEAFNFYKSAEVHTVKRNIPMRFFILLAIPFLIAAAVLYMWKFTDKQKTAPVTEKMLTNQNGLALSSQGGTVKASYQNALDDSKQFVFEQTARITGLPHTAPRYDELTKPSVVPVPAGCIASKSRCGCWTQQSTPIDMPEKLCRDIVKNGYFQDFDANGKDKKEEKNRSSVVAQNQVVPGASSDRIAMLGDSKIVAQVVPVSVDSDTFPRPQIQNRPKL